jgi:hypothetical protein
MLQLFFVIPAVGDVTLLKHCQSRLIRYATEEFFPALCQRGAGPGLQHSKEGARPAYRMAVSTSIILVFFGVIQ